MVPPPKHPDVPGCLVRLTDPAVEDLRFLHGKDPTIVRWCLKKLLVIERDPNAGRPLSSSLVGYRKITVSDRDWRIVWKVTGDEVGGYVVDVAEVWGIGYRKESEVYDEVRSRVEAAGDTPATRALTEVLALFEKPGRDLEPTPEPIEPASTPRWLVEALIRVAGYEAAAVDAMTAAEADSAWEAYTTEPRHR